LTNLNYKNEPLWPSAPGHLAGGAFLRLINFVPNRKKPLKPAARGKEAREARFCNSDFSNFTNFKSTSNFFEPILFCFFLIFIILMNKIFKSDQSLT
jgi:hypothetical protein